MPCFTGRRASSRSYVVFWVSPKWSHSFPGRHRSPLGLAPFVIDTPSVDVMGHARQASSTYARFDRLDIASGGRQRPSHFHPIVDTHPHTHTPIFSTQSSLVVTHAYAVGTASCALSHATHVCVLLAGQVRPRWEKLHDSECLAATPPRRACQSAVLHKSRIDESATHSGWVIWSFPAVRIGELKAELPVGEDRVRDAS